MHEAIINCIDDHLELQYQYTRFLESLVGMIMILKTVLVDGTFMMCKISILGVHMHEGYSSLFVCYTSLLVPFHVHVTN